MKVPSKPISGHLTDRERTSNLWYCRIFYPVAYLALLTVECYIGDFHRLLDQVNSPSAKPSEVGHGDTAIAPIECLTIVALIDTERRAV